MSQYTITAVDTTGIQDYVFGSNRLQENIGASELVGRATGEWALQAVREVAPHAHNVANPATLELKKDFVIEQQRESNAAEVLYAGGGNIVILFRQHESSCEFAFNLTRKVLEKAPGLSLVVAHHKQFDMEKASLSKAVQKLLGQQLSACKAARLPSTPLLGLGVTAVCDSTGLPATYTNKGIELGDGESRNPRVPLSGEVVAKRKVGTLRQAGETAIDRLNELLTVDQQRAFCFPTQLDDLGREFGQESYIAVVHTDGNGIGQKIRALAHAYSAPQQNRKYIEVLRSFSQQLNVAAKSALREVIGLLTRHPHQASRIKLPFRPLVFGGDDVTFVCRGHLGVALAAAYLEKFEEQPFCQEQKLSASAGIAIVKMHYPFARAYQLSDDLTRSAKKYRKDLEKKQGVKHAGSALDWHFAASGLSGSLEDIRALEYRPDDKIMPDGKLLLRPLLLRPMEHDPDGRAWRDRVEKLVLTFQDDRDHNKGQSRWSGRRNKLKALREALRAGPQAVTDFRRNYLDGELLPGFMPGEPYQDNGWFQERCGYFDALELFDHYESLKEEEADAA